MKPTTALILHPTRSTPKPVTTIHPQDASIERHGVILGEYEIRTWFGAFAHGSFIDIGGDFHLRTDVKRHPQRSPQYSHGECIAEKAVARAYRLVRTLTSSDPRVQAIFDEIAFRLRIANPFAER